MFERAARVRLYTSIGATRLSGVRALIQDDWAGFNDDAASLHGGLFDTEQRFVERHVEPGGRVLVIGSGTGRDVVALAKQGFRVTGVEPVARSVETCRQTLRSLSLDAEVHAGFIEDVELRAASFDAAMFSRFTFSYIPTAAGRVAALKNVAHAMKPDRAIFVSFITSGKASAWLIRAGRAAGAVARADWRLERGDSFYRSSPGCVRYEHVFDDDELEAHLTVAGLVRTETSVSTDYPHVIARHASGLRAVTASTSPRPAN